MTDIDNRSARSSERTEEERVKGEIRRLADALAIEVGRKSREPSVQIVSLLLASVAFAVNQCVTYAEIRSQLDELWRSCGGKVDGDLVQVVSRENFDNLVKVVK